jgi:hypothetical protein
MKRRRNIKNLKPRLDSRYNQGYYHPVNEEKYLGQKPIIYRSGWEYEFSKYCDITPEIVYWSSEPIGIRYYNVVTKKFHTYFPDYVIRINKGNGLYENFLVEVKPKSQLQKPKPPKKETVKSLQRYYNAYKTFIINSCKLKALKEFAKLNGYKTMIITEDSKVLKNGIN